MGEKALNAIDRYQEVLDTVIVGNRTGVYLSKEELQELLDYVKSTEAWLIARRVEDPTGPEFMAAEQARTEARKKLGLTESSPSA